MYICFYIEINLAHMHPQHRSGSRIVPFLLDFLESSIFCHIKDVWLTWMCCRGQKQTLFIERKKEDCEHRKSSAASEVHSEQTGNASQ